MKVNKEEIIKLFDLKKSGSRGWFLGTCAFCGKEEHMGVVFSAKISSFKCQRCGEHGSLWKLLDHVKRKDLIELFRPIKSLFYIEKPKIEKELEKDLIPPPLCNLPMGGKVLTKENNLLGYNYLISRGFNKEQFELYQPFFTPFHPILKNNYIIHPIIQEKEQKGWIARSIFDKKELLKINEYKKKGERKVLRYENSPSTPFEKLIFGLDEIVEGETHTVILVEGIYSKFNPDRLLDLYSSPEMKCLATFGKSLTPYQIYLLQTKKIQNIILLYDPDAIKESKEYSVELSKYFDVEVGYLPSNKDPGDINFEEIIEVLNNLETPYSFNLTKVQHKKIA